MAETLATSGRRVKVYVLNGAGKWDDRGIGRVRVEIDPITKAPVLKVTSDETGRISLASTIRPTDEAFYQMQEDNIISWNEEIPPGVPTEVALSFQETEGCRELWERIRHVDAAIKRSAAQRASDTNSRTHHGVNIHSGSGQTTATDNNAMVDSHATADGPATDPLASDANVQPSPSENLHNHANPSQGVGLVDPTAPDSAHTRFFEDSLEAPAWGNPDAIDEVVFQDTTNVLYLGTSPNSFVPSSNQDAGVSSGFVMPEPDRGGIETLSRIISDQATISMRTVREEIIGEILTSDYITKLCLLFRRAEHEGDLDCLATLYHIIRGLFVIGNTGVLEIMVSEKHLMDVVGCLEYDQDHMVDLQRRRAESTRKEDNKKKKKLESDSNSEAQRVSPKTGTSSEQNHNAEKEREVQHNITGRQREENVQTGTSDAVTAQTKTQTTRDNETLKGASGSKNTQHSSKNSQPGDDVEVNTNAVDTSPRSRLTASKEAHERDVECTTEKDNSEETSSSGNMHDGEAHPFSIRMHRDYLERKVSYRAVIPIDDQAVVAKIHQNYRVAYIRDVILSRVFDDGMSNMLSGVILCNNVDIIMYFISGSTALQELFTRLKATVQNRKRMLEASTTPRKCAYNASKDATTDLAKRPSKEVAPIARDGVTSHDSTERLTNAQSHDVKEVRDKPEHKQENDSSSGLETSPTFNPLSLTTTDSCPATYSNVKKSVHQASQGLHHGEKKPSNSATRNPKSVECYEELREDLRNMLGLLKELCQVVKGQQPAVQARFHRMLLELGALEISVSLLLDEDAILRSLCCDILTTVINQDQGDVRAHIMKNATQQHSSVPKQQIGSRKMATGAKPTEGTAIVTEAGVSGITAEAAIGEEQEAIAGEETNNSASGFDRDKSTAEDAARSPNQQVLSANGSRISGSRDMSNIENDLSKESQHELGSAEREASQTADAGNSEQTNTGDVARIAPKVSELQTSSSDADVGAHRMVSTSPETRGNEALDDQQDEIYRASILDDKQNPSRIETDLPLLGAMIEVICRDNESGVGLTVLELLRTLLDPMSMKPSGEKNLFLNAFYEKFVFRLLAPVEVATSPDKANGPDKTVSDENVSHICDLMSYCVSHHAFRSKYFVIGNNVGGKIIELVRHSKVHIRLAGVRFIKTCVGRRDDMYDRYVVEKRLLDPIMEMYAKNRYKDNLTSSSVLDLVSFLANARRELLLRHIIAEHSTALQPNTRNCNVFEKAKRVLAGIEKETALIAHEKNQGKDRETENTAYGKRVDGGSTEQQGSLNRHDTTDTSFQRGSMFLNHIDDDPNQLGVQNLPREGTNPSNLRAGTNFQVPHMRLFNEEDSFFVTLARGDAVQRLNSPVQDSAELHSRSREGFQVHGYIGRSLDQANMRSFETRGPDTPRGNLPNASPFKTGLRSVSQGSVPKRGQGEVKSVLVTGLRSQAVTSGEVVKSKSSGTSGVRRRLQEKDEERPVKRRASGSRSPDEANKLTDETPSPNAEDRNTNELQGEPDQQRNRKAIRMSLSKGATRSSEMTQLGEREDEVLLSESSDDQHSPRKRERVECQNSIETCTKSILERRNTGDRSPTKRRKVEEEERTDADNKEEKRDNNTTGEKSENREGLPAHSSGSSEALSKSDSITKPIQDTLSADKRQVKDSSDRQDNR